MEMIIPIFIVLWGSIVFTYKRMLRYLHFYQQEEYNSSRFLGWWWRCRAFDLKATSLLFLAGLFDSFTEAHIFTALSVALGLILFAWQESDPRVYGKLTLKMTERAKRILRVAWIISAVFALGLAVASIILDPLWLWLGLAGRFQIIPFILILSNGFLWWGERQRQDKFIQEAKNRLKEVSPFVIGITGSYGKTSTKDALGNILQVTLGPTFWPLKSINTIMGITKEIRLKLQEGTRFAVIEMGAYGRGSIQRLCDLTPPMAGIITGIGTAHLERFGTTDNIHAAKAELAQAIPIDGILVCNGDNPGARRIALENQKNTTLLYGLETSIGALDCWISFWKTTAKGTEFVLHWKGKEYSSFTPMFGRLALSNILAAFTLACSLGAQPDYVLAVIHTLTPVDNRLQLDKLGPITYFKDAYNSNPVGFCAALEVLQHYPGQRRIVMTPGMIELGSIQKEENEKVGRLAAQICDLVLVVGKTNREALVKGLQAGGLKPEQLFVCDTRESALQQLTTLRREGDVILIENDLVDLYEAKGPF